MRKRAAGACSRGLWIANVEHMKPVPGLWLPDFIMPPLSPLMISLLRHARLQRSPQLYHNSATLRRVCERCSRLCLLACLQAHVCATCVAPFWERIQAHVHDFPVQKKKKNAILGVFFCYWCFLFPTPGDVTLRYLQWWSPAVLPDDTLKWTSAHFAYVHELWAVPPKSDFPFRTVSYE